MSLNAVLHKLRVKLYPNDVRLFSAHKKWFTTLLLIISTENFAANFTPTGQQTLNTTPISLSKRSSDIIRPKKTSDSIRHLPEFLDRALRKYRLPQEALSLVVKPLGRAPVLALNSSTPRNPASTMKLLTSYFALEALGPAYTWKTKVYALGRIDGTRLKGDLGIKGSGDPYLVLEEFWKLLYELRNRGIKSIEGDLIIDDTLFKRTFEDPAAFDGSPHRLYNTIPNALMVNFQSARFTVQKLGSRQVGVSVYPPLANLKINNLLRLSKKACGGYNLGVGYAALNPKKRDHVELSGQFPAKCGSHTFARAVLEPHTYVHGLFMEIWQQLGGTFSGSVKRQKITIKNKPILTWYSRPLREIITASNKYSNNVMTRQLLLSIAAKSNRPPATVTQGVQAMKTFLSEKGISVTGLVVENGSGLSRKSRVTATLLTQLLEDAYASPLMPEFMASLPLNGIDGSMRKRTRGENAAGHAHVKTGRLNGVIGLAGYVQARSGQRYTLTLLVNHPDAHKGSGRAIGDTMIRWIYEQG